jgi:hypothetical protein
MPYFPIVITNNAGLKNLSHFSLTLFQAWDWQFYKLACLKND